MFCLNLTSTAMRKPRMLVWGNDHQPAWDGEGEEEGPVTLLVGGKILDPGPDSRSIRVLSIYHIRGEVA